MDKFGEDRGPVTLWPAPFIGGDNVYKGMLYVKNWEIEISLTSAMRIIDGLWLYDHEATFAVNADDTNGEPFPFNVLFFQFKDIKKIIITEVNDNEHTN